MDEDAIEKLLEKFPSQISPPELTALIANIVNMYGFPHLWPMLALQITNLLHERSVVCEAVEDAEDFMNKIKKGKMN